MLTYDDLKAIADVAVNNNLVVLADEIYGEIVYEGRTHNAEVTDQAGMDTAFQDVFSDYNLQERLSILGYGSRDAYLEHPAHEQFKQLLVQHLAGGLADLIAFDFKVCDRFRY